MLKERTKKNHHPCMYVLARSTYDSQCCRRESQKPIQIYQWHKVNAKKVHIVRLVDGVSDGFLLSPHNFDIYIYVHVCAVNCIQVN